MYTLNNKIPNKKKKKDLNRFVPKEIINYIISFFFLIIIFLYYNNKIKKLKKKSWLIINKLVNTKTSFIIFP